MVNVVTIDGPSGAGKGTIAHKLAQQWGFHLLDSGALYRLTALAAERHGCSFADDTQLAHLAEHLDVEFKPVASGIEVLLEGDEVTKAIRQEHVGMNASKVAAIQQVRDALLQRQRDFATAPGLVADGRDMGTRVFPDAALKIFLTASAEARAKRRLLQLQQSGQEADYEKILADIEQRDLSDRARASSPLLPAEDANLIDCTNLSINEVLSEVQRLYDQRVSSQ